MADNINAGESIPVPCRHCASVSINLPLQAGIAVQTCPKCKTDTRFIIKSGTGGWEIRSQAMPNVEPKPRHSGMDEE